MGIRITNTRIYKDKYVTYNYPTCRIQMTYYSYVPFPPFDILFTRIKTFDSIVSYDALIFQLGSSICIRHVSCWILLDTLGYFNDIY